MEVSDRHSKRRMVWICFNYGIIAGVAAGLILDEWRVAGRKRFGSNRSTCKYPNVDAALYIFIV